MRQLYSLFSSIAEAMAASLEAVRWPTPVRGQRPHGGRDRAAGKRKRPNRLHISRRARRRHRRAA